MWPNPQFPADLVTFTEEILNGKIHFLCSALTKKSFVKNIMRSKVIQKNLQKEK